MEQFIKGIEKPTLVLICNDCYYLKWFTKNNQCQVITLFGGFVFEDDLNQICEALSKRNLQLGLDILMIGHCRCHLKKQLNWATFQANYWNEIERNSFLIRTNAMSNESNDNRCLISKLHLLIQIQKINEYPLLVDKIALGKLKVKGVLINEFDNNKIIEFFQPCSLHMGLNLN